MQGERIIRWKEGLTSNAMIHLGFVILLKLTLFFEQLEKYDRMSKAMRREDRRQEY